MPHSDLHKQKRRKNYTLLAIIFGFCIVVFIMTMVKMAHSDGIPDKYKAEREAHQETIEEKWEEYDEQGVTHQQEIEDAAESWWYGDDMSDQAREIMAVKEGTQLEWESDEDYAERMATSGKNEISEDDSGDDGDDQP